MQHTLRYAIPVWEPTCFAYEWAPLPLQLHIEQLPNLLTVFAKRAHLLVVPRLAHCLQGCRHAGGQLLAGLRFLHVGRTHCAMLCIDMTEQMKRLSQTPKSILVPCVHLMQQQWCRLLRLPRTAAAGARCTTGLLRGATARCCRAPALQWPARRVGRGPPCCHGRRWPGSAGSPAGSSSPWQRPRRCPPTAPSTSAHPAHRGAVGALLRPCGSPSCSST